MIVKPGISTLENCVEDGCRYVLVSVAAKRARMIGEKGEGLVPCESKKPVSVAINEIVAGRVGHILPKSED